MLEYKAILGSLSVLVAFIAYVIYFTQIFSGKVKPHAFSWLVWTLTTGIVFYAQVVKHAGAGSWVLGITSLACLLIFIAGLFKGNKNFIFWDWIFLSGAIAALILWWLTKEPTLSVILITLTDALAMMPTLLKGFSKPHEDSLILFFLSSLKAFISLFALESYSLVTWLYPTRLVVMNALTVFVLLVRRQQIKNL